MFMCMICQLKAGYALIILAFPQLTRQTESEKDVAGNSDGENPRAAQDILHAARGPTGILEGAPNKKVTLISNI